MARATLLCVSRGRASRERAEAKKQKLEKQTGFLIILEFTDGRWPTSKKSATDRLNIQ